MKVIKAGGHRLFDSDLDTSKTVSEMLLDLERNGMEAVRKYSLRFDSWNPKSFELTPSEIETASKELAEQTRKDTEFCQNNVREFAKAQLKTLLPLEVEIRPGVILGHKHLPVSRVGSYIPGGRYPLFGSAQMSIIPAKVAGVKQIIACTPPVTGGKFFPATIHAMKTAGADRVFVLGGVPAFALMAFGMGVVNAVDMVCGAGNKYVAEAKRQLFGRCGIDLLAGPSEILIIADESADPELVACDLLGQAEHDPSSGLNLICFSEKFAKETLAQIDKQMMVLPTKTIASLSWRDNGIVSVAENWEEAIAMSDEYAPEHLELHVEDSKPYVDKLSNYGSLFIGEETTVAYGDKAIGTNHILPTSRAARYTGGVWVGKFLKTCTYQRVTKIASVEIAEVTERQCEVERMPGHGITARRRIERYKN